MVDLHGRVAIVTGASRGVGKGIALGLGEAGATVYVTGRTVDDSRLPPFLKGTTVPQSAQEVSLRGGVGIAHPCDLGDDAQMEELFQRVSREQGRLDLLVNNAWSAADHILGGYFFGTPFWEQPLSLWDDLMNVGLRCHYAASRWAARMMVPKGEGLMVNISYYGSRHYMNNVVYGVRQGAIDKLSADMAHELAPFNVCSLSLYPGVVRTEGMVAAAAFDPAIGLSGSESPLFVGRCVAALCWERDRSAYNGTTLYTADLGRLYGIEEENGFRPERSEGERR